MILEIESVTFSKQTYCSLLCFGASSKGSFGYKLQKRRLWLNIWKKFLMVRVVRRWNRLLREVFDTSSLEIFKQRFNRQLLEIL